MDRDERDWPLSTDDLIFAIPPLLLVAMIVGLVVWAYFG